MATSIEFIEYVCEQITGVGTIRYRKMFGEYMVYVNEKPILLVCDNTVYVKMHPSIDPLMVNAKTGVPYPGAKLHYILDIDDRELSQTTLQLLELHLAIPKPKKQKSRRTQSK